MAAAVEKVEALVAQTIETPIGQLTLVASARGLSAVLWENEKPGRVPLEFRSGEHEHPILVAAQRQLAEYFAGARRSFDLPLAAFGTPFQARVWAALATIPFGETRSYRQIAEQIGQPQAMRAVGAANGKNPLSIVVPCHRVIGASGQLVGFAGGLDIKARLLAHERPTVATPLS